MKKPLCSAVFGLLSHDYRLKRDAPERKIGNQKAEKDEKTKKAADIRLFMKELEKRDEPLTQFDDMLWLST